MTEEQMEKISNILDEVQIRMEELEEILETGIFESDLFTLEEYIKMWSTATENIPIPD